MSKLKELIDELCPDGVEYKRLDEICEIQNGYTPLKSNEEFWNDGNIPWFRMEDIRKNGKELNDAIQYINIKGVRGKVFPANSIIFATTATIGEHALITVPFVCNQQLTHIHLKDNYINKIKIRFLFHYADKIDQLCEKNVKGTSTMKAVDIDKFKSFMIPVPPLEVQNEIVRILDNFTELTSELTSELVAREKQYEHYRDKLLSYDHEKVNKVRLGDFAKIIRGGNFQKKDFVETGRPCIHYGQIYTYYGISTDKTITFLTNDEFNKSKKASKNDIITAITSENVEDVCKSVAWLGDEDVAVSGHTAIIKHNQNPKYLSYYFSSNIFATQKKQLAHGTKVIEVTPASLENIEIPLPSMEVQNKIVEVLDNFDAICKDLNIGLPAEKKAREQQYEYYRDMLLTSVANGGVLYQTEELIRLVQYVLGYAYVRLGDIVRIKNGKDYKHLKEGKYPVYGSGGIMAYVNDFCYNKRSVLIPRKGSLKNIFYMETPFWNVDTIFYTEVNDKIVLPKYLYYFLQNYHVEDLNIAGGVPSLTQKVLEAIAISFPTLEEQQRIVDILDKFEKLTNDITEGLPAEIKYRQQQYEYYRDMLLNFNKIEN